MCSKDQNKLKLNSTKSLYMSSYRWPSDISLNDAGSSEQHDLKSSSSSHNDKGKVRRRFNFCKLFGKKKASKNSDCKDAKDGVNCEEKKKRKNCCLLKKDGQRASKNKTYLEKRLSSEGKDEPPKQGFIPPQQSAASNTNPAGAAQCRPYRKYYCS